MLGSCYETLARDRNRLEIARCSDAFACKAPCRAHQIVRHVREAGIAIRAPYVELTPGQIVNELTQQKHELVRSVEIDV